MSCLPAGQVAGYAGLLLATPTVLYEVVSYVVPGLTKQEKDLLAPIVFGSSILFYIGCVYVVPSCNDGEQLLLRLWPGKLLWLMGCLLPCKVLFLRFEMNMPCSCGMQDRVHNLA